MNENLPLVSGMNSRMQTQIRRENAPYTNPVMSERLSSIGGVAKLVHQPLVIWDGRMCVIPGSDTENGADEESHGTGPH